MFHCHYRCAPTTFNVSREAVQCICNSYKRQPHKERTRHMWAELGEMLTRFASYTLLPLPTV